MKRLIFLLISLFLTKADLAIVFGESDTYSQESNFDGDSEFHAVIFNGANDSINGDKMESSESVPESNAHYYDSYDDEITTKISTSTFASDEKLILNKPSHLQQIYYKYVNPDQISLFTISYERYISQSIYHMPSFHNSQGYPIHYSTPTAFDTFKRSNSTQSSIGLKNAHTLANHLSSSRYPFANAYHSIGPVLYGLKSNLQKMTLFPNLTSLSNVRLHTTYKGRISPVKSTDINMSLSNSSLNEPGTRESERFYDTKIYSPLYYTQSLNNRIYAKSSNNVLPSSPGNFCENCHRKINIPLMLNNYKLTSNVFSFTPSRYGIHSDGTNNVNTEKSQRKYTQPFFRTVRYQQNSRQVLQVASTGAVPSVPKFSSNRAASDQPVYRNVNIKRMGRKNKNGRSSPRRFRANRRQRGSRKPRRKRPNLRAQH